MFAQPGCLFRCLHAFRDGGHIEPSGQHQHGIKHRRGDGFCPNGVNETPVNFDVVHGEVLKIDQRAVAGTEIINRYLKPFVVQPFEQIVGFTVIEHVALGNFQHQLEVIRRE